MSNFKPCPFCTCEVEETVAVGEKWIRCPHCNAASGMVHEQGVHLWNNRPIEDKLRAEVEKLTEAIYTLCENDCHAFNDATVRELVKARGCGGERTSTIDGEDFDCTHKYAWTCDACPMQEVFHLDKAAQAGEGS